jgi:hypothetical protein
LRIESTENSSPCKNSLDRKIGVPKSASAGERLRLLSAVYEGQGVQKVTPRHCGSYAKRILETAVQSFDCTIGLRMISCCLAMQNL